MHLIRQWSLVELLSVPCILLFVYCTVILPFLQQLLRWRASLEHFPAAPETPSSCILLRRQLSLFRLKSLQITHDLVNLLLHIKQVIIDLLLLGNSLLPFALCT